MFGVSVVVKKLQFVKLLLQMSDCGCLSDFYLDNPPQKFSYWTFIQLAACAAGKNRKFKEFYMQKKIIALAVAAALVAPAAFADTSNVTVYGKLFADFENVKSSNVGAGVSNSLNRVSSNASRFGIKGSEDLGDGMKAVWQYEAQFDLNGGGAAGTAGFGNGTRNSHVGLAGGFGTAAIGVWDSPYKLSHNKVELFDNTTFGSAINVLGRVNGGLNMNNRLANSVTYWTPNLSGFAAQFAYGTDNAKTNALNKSVVSMNASYENDMFYAAFGYESFKDVNLANAALAGNKADGNRLVGAYKFDQGLVGLPSERLSGTTAGVSATRNAWELAGKYTMGASNIGLSYVKAGNLGAAVNSGAKQLSLRYGYNFSKRTELYGMYSALTNDAAANYNFTGGNIVTGSVAGAKLSGFGVGLVHTF